MIGTAESSSAFETVFSDRGRWVLRSDADVVLDGEIRLDRRLQDSDSAIAWDGEVSTQFPMTERPLSFRVDVSYPANGGNVLIRNDPNATVPLSINAIDIRADNGSLNAGTTSLPFETISDNSAEHWSASSDSLIELPVNGWIELNVAASSGATGQATVSDGLDELTVSLTRIQTDPMPSIIGGYSMMGGPVSIASNAPITLRSLRIDSSRGRLIGGQSAAPFESVTANSPRAWAVESIEQVVIDGVIALDLEVEPGAFLTGQTSNGSTTSPLVFNGFNEEIRARWTSDDPFFVAYPEEGGKLMILHRREPLLHPSISSGIEFIASEGLIEAGTNPAPFAFFIPNSAAPGNVTLGTLGTPAEIDSVAELDITVAGNTLAGAFIASRGPHVSDLPVVIMPNLESFATASFCVAPTNELVGDLDDNGTVEFRDFLVLAGNFGLEVDTYGCLLYTSPSPRDKRQSRMPSSA